MQRPTAGSPSTCPSISAPSTEADTPYTAETWRSEQLLPQLVVHGRQSTEDRKSINSVRRKPVPELDTDSLADEGSATPSSCDSLPSQPEHAGHWADFSAPTYHADADAVSPRLPSEPVDAPSASAQPPRYVLPVEPPLPSYSSAQDSSSGLPTQLGQPLTPSTTHEDLPRYAADTQTEPKTLARSLWQWGWICPLFWVIGLCILWIPLKPTEEELDPEKAQKLEEMIVILRETELKYARRCLWGFIGFLVLVVLAVLVVVVVTRFV